MATVSCVSSVPLAQPEVGEGCCTVAEATERASATPAPDSQRIPTPRPTTSSVSCSHTPSSVADLGNDCRPSPVD